MKIRKNFIISGVLFLLFLLFTILVMEIDVRPVGPQQSAVGLASVNLWFHDSIGVHLVWYHITDWLGVTAILTALGFGVLGLLQSVKRKSILKADKDIIALGIYYVVVMAVYVFFEICIVNYRPVLMEGKLEASFPSSHTLITLCIMVTAMMQFHRRIRRKGLRLAAQGVSAGIIAVTIAGRVISGVHWFTDILSGVLLAGALIMLYYAVINNMQRKKQILTKI